MGLLTLPAHPLPTRTLGYSVWRKGICSHRKYALLCKEYDELREMTGGRCWLCSKPEDISDPGRILMADHDHKVGLWAVRGLLCRGCNGRVECPETNPHLDIEGYLGNPWWKRVGRTERPKYRRNQT